MPLFMDFHQIENVTVEDVKAAHIADEAIQDQYGVKYHQFWVNQEAGTIFCLIEGPDKESCQTVHRLAHGNIACALTEVEPGFYKIFMGEGVHVDQGGLVKHDDGTIDLGYRNILVASIRGITQAKNLNDLQLLQIPNWARSVVSQNLAEFNGREIKWATDDSLIGVFNDSTEAIKCAIQIQRDLLVPKSHKPKVIFKIGVSADQPVTEEGDFYTKAIKLAYRLSNVAKSNQILISSLVKSLCKEGAIRNSSLVKSLDATEEKFVSNLLDITDENLSDGSFTIDKMCRNIGVSRPQLYRKITSVTGRAPNDFVRDLRMEKALMLIKQKAGNISHL